MPKPTALQIIKDNLYSDDELIPANYRDRVKRVRCGYAFWYESATKNKKQVCDHLVNEFGITRRTAYEDVQFIEIVLANVKNAAKSWLRYKVNAMCEAAYELAERLDDPRGMVMAADKLGKYNQLDKPEAEPLPYGDIVPQHIEPTDDPRVIGMKVRPNIRQDIKIMMAKYAKEIDVIDVDYEEIDKLIENKDPFEKAEELINEGKEENIL